MPRPIARLTGAIAVLVAVTFVFAACGGSDPTATPPPTTAPTATQPAQPTATQPAQPAATQPAQPTAPPPTATSAPARPTPTPRPALPTQRPTPEGERPRSGGVLQARALLAFEPWDTYDVRSRFGTETIQNVLNNLIFLDPQDPNLILPDLAERWEISSDGRTVTFHLRSGVTWHDGEAFTAEDVVYSLSRAWKPEPPLVVANVAITRFVENIEAVDDLTVRVTLVQPSASFLVGVAVPFMLMYPAHLPDIENQWRPSPVGTGPFIWESDDPRMSVKLVKNEAYYKEDANGVQLPYLDGMDVFFLPNPTVSLAAFRAGRVDCICTYSDEATTVSTPALQREFPGGQFFQRSPDTIAFYFSQKPPFDDVRVRRAIAIGIDRVGINKLVFPGAEGHFPSGYLLSRELGGKWALSAERLLAMPGWSADKSVDLAMARDLLQEAGIDPSTVTVRVIAGPQYHNTGQGFIDSLSIIGFDTDFQAMDRTTYSDAFRRADFDIAFQTGGRVVDDPFDVTGDWVTTGRPRNTAMWSDPVIDQLFVDQDLELDPLRRAQLLENLQLELFEKSFYVPLASIPATVGHSEKVRGYVPGLFNATSAHRFDRVWLVE